MNHKHGIIAQIQNMRFIYFNFIMKVKQTIGIKKVINEYRSGRKELSKLNLLPVLIYYLHPERAGLRDKDYLIIR